MYPKITRRNFLGHVRSTIAACASSTSLAKASSPSNTTLKKGNFPATIPNMPFIWGNLLHLSFNMWSDRPVDSWGHLQKEDLNLVTYQPYLRLDDTLWNDLTQRMANVEMNMVVIDLGDGIQYQSHPEIAVKGAWTEKRLRNELDRLRKLGLEPIPKLNFSTSHDVWLGPYGKLDSHGYDQVPTGSNWSHPKNFELMVKYCQDKISPEHLKGFLMAPWLPTLEKFRQKHLEAINQVKAAMETFSESAKKHLSN